MSGPALYYSQGLVVHSKSDVRETVEAATEAALAVGLDYASATLGSAPSLLQSCHLRWTDFRDAARSKLATPTLAVSRKNEKSSSATARRSGSMSAPSNGKTGNYRHATRTPSPSRRLSAADPSVVTTWVALWRTQHARPLPRAMFPHRNGSSCRTPQGSLLDMGLKKRASSRQEAYVRPPILAGVC